MSTHINVYLGNEKEAKRRKKQFEVLAKKAGKKSISEYIRDLGTIEWLKQRSGNIR